MQDIKGTLINITKSAAKTSGDLIKTTKLSMSLSGEQDNIKKLYMEIGKKVHEIYAYGGSLGKYFDEKYLELEACERKIEEIREQISLIKGTRECLKCGKTVERTMEFCPKCGIRLGDPAFSPTPDASGGVIRSDIPAGEAGYGMQPRPSEMYVPTEHPASETAAIHPASHGVHIAPMPSQPPTIPSLPTTTAAPAPLPPDTPSPAHKRCRVCGASNDNSSKFCLSCGRILD